jgi:hypothetical protein
MATICKQFAAEYSKETNSVAQLNETELLRLILKLKPNAKDE